MVTQVNLNNRDLREFQEEVKRKQAQKLEEMEVTQNSTLFSLLKLTFSFQKIELKIEIAEDTIFDLRTENDALKSSLQSLSQQLERAVRMKQRVKK